MKYEVVLHIDMPDDGPQPCDCYIGWNNRADKPEHDKKHISVYWRAIISNWGIPDLNVIVVSKLADEKKRGTGGNTRNET